MGCCCGAPSVANDNMASKSTNESTSSKRKSESALSRKGKVSAQSNYTINFNEEEEEEEVNDIYTPKYFSFKQFFEEEENHSVNGYNFLQLIGSGSMSSVYQVQEETTKEILAAKVYNLSQLCKPTLGNEEAPIDGVNREIKLMTNMSNPYILELIYAFDNYEINSRILIFPFAENGNIQSLLEQRLLQDDNIILCFKQIAIALEYMHSLNIVHRDIKPENILCFNKSHYVLSDFSVSSMLKDNNQYFEDTKGSPAFFSPEECSGERFLPKPADVWAYGISLYSAIFGFLPYKLDEAESRSLVNTVIIVTEKLGSQKLTFPTQTINNNPVDNEIITLLKDVLNKDPSKRPSFNQIVKYKCFLLTKQKNII